MMPLTASASSPMVSGSVNASVRSIMATKEFGVTVSLTGIPYTGKVIPNDVVLLIDTSGSMGGKSEAIKEAAKHFVSILNTSVHQVGVVTYDDLTTELPLTGDKAALTNFLDNIPNPRNSTAMDKGINEAVGLLAAKRTNTTGAIVLMTDGQPNSGSAAEAAATAAKNKGYVFYTVTLTDDENSSANVFLKKLATSETDHYSVLSKDKLNSVYSSIASKIGACNARNVVLEQTIQPEFEYVAGSADTNIPRPTISGNKLTWTFPQLSKGVSKVSFRVRAKDVTPGNYRFTKGHVSYTNYNKNTIIMPLNSSLLKVEGLPKSKNIIATPGDKKVSLTWDAVPNATKYKVVVYNGNRVFKIVYAMDGSAKAVVEGLTNGTEYGFWVQAYVNGAYDSEPDTTKLVYATPRADQKPEAITPTGLTAVAGDKQVKLSWNAVTGATKYRVVVYSGTKFVKNAYVSGGTTTETTVTGLTNGTKYGFWVQSYVEKYSEDPDMNGLVYATPIAPDTKPATPAGLTLVPGDKQVTVSWTAVPGATKYKVVVYSGTTFLKNVIVFGGTTTSKVVTGLTNGKEYGFWVQSYVKEYSAAPNVNALAHATPAGANNAAVTPANITVVPGDKQVNVSWNAVPGATKYKVVAYLGNNVAKSVYVSGGTTTTAVVAGLTNGKDYGFWVQSYVKEYSAAPNVNALVHATPVGTAQTAVTPTGVSTVEGDKQIKVSWNAVPGATKYKITIYSGSNFVRSNFVTAPTTSAVITGLTNGTEYGIWVQSYVNGYSSEPVIANLKKATPHA